MPQEPENVQLLQLTAQIISAHVSHNSVPAEALGGLIREVYLSLKGEPTADTKAQQRPEPAVSPSKSVLPDYIICLEDGKKLKMLRRHLKSAYGMTPEQYRERWNLRPDYPMVAPNYAQQRSNLAKKIGLGTKPAAHAPVLLKTRRK